MVNLQPPHPSHALPPRGIGLVRRHDDVRDFDAFTLPQLVLHFLYAPSDDRQRCETLLDRGFAPPLELTVAYVYSDVLSVWGLEKFSFRLRNIQLTGGIAWPRWRPNVCLRASLARVSNFEVQYRCRATCLNAGL